MRHPGGSRVERRIRARREALANAMTPRPPKELRAGRPKYGVAPTPEQASEREKLLQKFGNRAEERKADRRQLTMSPTEVDAWLKHNGIAGTDRRKADRRIR